MNFLDSYEKLFWKMSFYIARYTRSMWLLFFFTLFNEPLITFSIGRNLRSMRQELD